MSKKPKTPNLRTVISSEEIMLSAVAPTLPVEGTGLQLFIDPQPANASVLAIASRIRERFTANQIEINLSTRQLVVELKADIRKWRRDGRSWKAIAAVFADEGVTVDPETLRKYVNTAVPTRAARSKKKFAPPIPVSHEKPATTPDVKATNEAATARTLPVETRSEGARISLRVR